MFEYFEPVRETTWPAACPFIKVPPEREQVSQRLHIRHCKVETACDCLSFLRIPGARPWRVSAPKDLHPESRNEFFVGVEVFSPSSRAEASA